MFSGRKEYTFSSGTRQLKLTKCGFLKNNRHLDSIAGGQSSEINAKRNEPWWLGGNKKYQKEKEN